jgi:hypothetical protein
MKTGDERIRRMLLPSTLFLGLALVGCDANSNNRNSANQTSPAANSEAAGTPGTASTQPVHLTGCLQKGSRGAYILTRMNVPEQRNPSNEAGVARDRAAAAEQAYRLTGNGDNDLSKLVGAEVRVEGTMTKRSDLTAKNGTENGAVGMSGQSSGSNKASNRDIDQGDLAEVNVSSVEKVSDGCGAGSAAGKSGAKRR